jgi:beta-hydroxylase
MIDFSDYNINPAQFDFLNPLQGCWTAIRDEFTRFINSNSPDIDFAYQVMGPKSKTIKTATGGYNAFGLLFQGLWIEDYLQAHNICDDHQSVEEIAKRAAFIRKTWFPRLSQLLSEVSLLSIDRLRTVYFGTFQPGLRVKLHINDNPHLYRGYLGLIVPEGDVAMRICHDTLYWHEGEFMVLDHCYPHCPHNNTEYPRTVLVVDFFKPQMPHIDALNYENEQISRRLREDPKSLGVFGGSDKADPEDFIRYGMQEQLSWDKGLQPPEAKP